jgi:hypothetical protein
VSADQICNGGETELFWRRLTTTAVSGEHETEASGFKQNNDSLTVLTCANDIDTQAFKLRLEI